jgi:hypothetical protein
MYLLTTLPELIIQLISYLQNKIFNFFFKIQGKQFGSYEQI